MRPIEEDRIQLETAEARVLAHNFKDAKTLEQQLKVSEKHYGRGSAERIKGYMRQIWRLEMCK